MHKKNKENTHDWTILYIIAGIALILSVLNAVGVFSTETGTWRCNYAECTEYTEISGQEWAQDNCFITEQGTICVIALEDGTQQQVALEELDLSEITATKCLEYTCVDEIMYREANYTVDLENMN